MGGYTLGISVKRTTRGSCTSPEELKVHVPVISGA